MDRTRVVATKGRNLGGVLYPPTHLARSVQTGMDTMVALLDEVNGGNEAAVAAGMLQALVNGHRYLQNEVMLALFRVIQTYGELIPESSYVDGRNEGSYKMAKKLARVLNEDWGSMLNVCAFINNNSEKVAMQEAQAELDAERK